MINRKKEVIAIVLVMIFGSYLFSHLSYELLLSKPAPSLLDIWNKWDSPSYLDIAENGYRGFGDEMWVRIVSLPFYPFLIWIFALIVRSQKLGYTLYLGNI